jgi:hypothetical protein
MLLGYADGRKINAVGASMERRSFLSTHLSGAWLAEVRPFMSVSDPTMKGFTLEFPQQPAYSGVVNFTSAVPVDKPVTSAPLNVILVTQNHVYEGTATYIAGTRSTFVSGVSPLGYKLKAFPHRRLQPFVTGLGGFAVSPRDIPVFNSSELKCSRPTHAPSSWSIATITSPTPATVRRIRGSIRAYLRRPIPSDDREAGS